MISSGRMVRLVPAAARGMGRHNMRAARAFSGAGQGRLSAAPRSLGLNGLAGPLLSPCLTLTRAPARPLSTPALPEHILVNLPALSPTMEMGTVVSWEKKEGDQLSEGDLLAEIETDKATMGMETPEEGWLAKIFIPAGAKDIPLGKLLCIIVSNEEDIAAFKDFKPTDDAPAPATSAPETPAAAAAPTPAPSAAAPVPAAAPASAAPSGIVFASPYAKKLAKEKGVDLQAVAASTGKGASTDSIVQGSDVEAWLAAGAPVPASAPAAAAPVAPSAPSTGVPVSGMRATIARRLVEAKSTVPEYYLSVDVQMDAISELRSTLNAALAASGSKLSVNDFIIKASALACQQVPECNSQWAGDVIRQFSSVDVSVAVATEGGLITPIVASADTKGLKAISDDVKRLAAKARDGKLQPHEYQGGTFSVSNLGMGGVRSFVAVINPPQSCILAVGETRPVVVPCDSEQGHRTVSQVTVTLTCDHRTVDGAVGARWLQVFKGYLEAPHTMLL